MRRVISHFAILFGSLALLFVGMLAYARRDAPDDWIIFSVNQRYKNDFDIYRVLSDGTHTKRFAFTTDQYSSISRLPENPGWLVVYDNISTDRHLQLRHILGHIKLDITEGTAWPSLISYDRRQQVAFVTFAEDFLNTRAIWQIDTSTGERTAFELPFTLDQVRYEFADGGYIVWSDHASAGDLYSVRFTNPPQVKRLTTHGKVLSAPSTIGSAGWLYYLVDDGDPDAFNHLYRIGSNGKGEQLVAEQVLSPPNAIGFWQGDSDTIYYWGGDEANPHLITAELDGTQATELPIPVLYGWVNGWSPDRQWLYYTESSPSYATSPAAGGNLRRVNLQTGENEVVWEPSNLRQMLWSADREWLLLLTWEQSGYLKLYKMRPDGSDITVLLDNVRSSYLEWTENRRFAVFGTWGVVGEELHLLDLRTLEIRRLHDDAPPLRMRQFLTTLPMPEFDWQAGWLVGIGTVAVGLGVIAQRRR